jgi:hypothetical protein
METIAQKIEEITADQLIETANEVLASDKLSMLIFK